MPSSSLHLFVSTFAKPSNHVKCKIVKNKVAPPFRVAEFDILYGKGISLSGEIIDFAIALDVIQKSGSWFSYNGERIGQGKDNVRKLIENTPDLMKEIENKVRQLSEQAKMLMDQEFEVDEDDDDEFDLRLSDDE